MKLFETNFSKEKPELIAAPVLLSTFKFQLLKDDLMNVGRKSRDFSHGMDRPLQAR